jgi:ATP-dependent helicase HrpA
MVLGMAVAGLDALQVEFFHRPDRKKLVAARRMLEDLGALEADGVVTEVGLKMQRLPVEARVARMVVAAEDPDVLDAVLTMAACAQHGRLRTAGQTHGSSPRDRSDALDQLAVFHVARRLPGEARSELGIDADAYRRVRGTLDHLRRVVPGTPGQGERADPDAVLRAWLAGLVDRLYAVDDGTLTHPRDPHPRTLRDGSVLAGRLDVRWVVGLRVDEPGPDGRRLVDFATVVDPGQLPALAPDLTAKRLGEPRHDRTRGTDVVDRLHLYDGHTVWVETLPDAYAADLDDLH